MLEAKHVHIIGVGGIGTSAVAKWYFLRGAKVTGSDVYPSEILTELDRMGIEVKIGHFADNIPSECDLVIYSKAVPATNIERQTATERGIEDASYAEFLGALSKTKKTIAVAGTNGKSTTTSMLGSILKAAGLKPTVIVGTKNPAFTHGNLEMGDGEYFVVEACEHMASMLSITAEVVVITNIEEDHLDFYKDLDDIKKTFQEWIDSLPRDARVIVNANDRVSQSLSIPKRAIFDVEERVVEHGAQHFLVAGDPVRLTVPGLFNAMNAAAAMTAARAIGIETGVASEALGHFHGTWRRFEHVGLWQDADVYSDYAHHPTAIRGTIEALKEFFENRRLILCFEPHQHARTKELFDQFVPSFDGVDGLLLCEIYEVAGRNNEGREISSENLMTEIKKRGTIRDIRYAKDYEAVESELRDMVQAGDILIFMGAGTIDELARKLAK
ncbi:MAG: UDP-N-acetylmuramate--L-alanine ligase [Patescibacteria group bacterium]|jgi:UDP-N-acetylmuramate--alanine ligase